MEWTFPYRSLRMPVLADNVVATSQPLAAQAGLEMLHRGGNAVDAALAAAVTLTVVEPTSNGLGGDAFALVWDGARLHGLNSSGRSPAALDPEPLLGHERMPARGWDTVTVPGAVSAWVALSERFGALDFPELFGPAVRYAREGWVVSPITALAWERAPEIFEGFEDFAAAFLPGHRAPRAGERFALPDQADTLAAIAASGGEAFYRGALAERIDAAARSSGAALRASDLATHEAEWVDPLSVEFRDWHVHELPPNGQGVAALIALGILRTTPVTDLPVDSADWLHWQIEAMKLALADVHRYVADPQSMEIAPASLLERDYLASRATLIDPHRAGDPGHGIPVDRGTVYLATADADGRMVSLIQSNYAGFGSGVVVPETGIALQNRGAGFSTVRGHPNQVEGGKRPFHTIIPAFATRGDLPALAFGVMGGPMQPQGHVQMVLRVLVAGQNPQAASDAPRWRLDGGTNVAVEPGFSDDVLDDLAQRGHHLSVAGDAGEAAASAAVGGRGSLGSPFGFGGAQLIAPLERGWLAASDHRKDGQAVGF